MDYKSYGEEYAKIAKDIVKDLKEWDEVTLQDRDQIEGILEERLYYEDLLNEEETDVDYDLLSDMCDDIMDYIDEKVEEKIDNNDCFEVIYAKALDQNKELGYTNKEVGIYVTFVNLVNKAFGNEEERKILKNNTF